MNEQVKQIAARIRELREILDIPQEEVAKKVEVSLGEYQKYEQAEDKESGSASPRVNED